MSLHSPTKKQRIERHLMRQRGAGVRTLSTNFGFSFGLSAPASSNATPASEEPPAKRRKTTSHDDLPATAPIDVILPKPEQPFEAPKTVMAKKPRKRLFLDADDEPSQPASTADVDDSFIFGFGLKKQAVRTSKKVVAKPVEEVVVEVAEKEKIFVAKGRSKRSAAVHAAVKVVDALEEEAAPIDKKRQDVITAKKVKKGRKRPVQAVEDAVDADVEAESKVLPRPNPRAPAKRGTKRKAQVETVENVDVVVEVPVPEVVPSVQVIPSLQEDSKVQDIVPTKKAPRKPRKDVAAKPQPPLINDEQLLNEIPETQDAHDRFVPPTPPVKEASKDPSKRGLAMKQSQSRSSPKRQPLAERGTNRTVQSISPEKPAVEDEEVQAPTKATMTKRKGAMATDTAVEVTVKRQKMVGQYDDHDTKTVERPNTTIAFENGRARTSILDEVAETHSARGTEQPTPEPIQEPEARKARGAKLNPKSKQRVRDVEKPSQPTNKFTATTTNPLAQLTEHERDTQTRKQSIKDKQDEDDDVDWLFAPQPQASKQQPKKAVAPTPSVTTVKPSKSKGTRTRIADIDLDDLLSNIASFAQEQAAVKGVGKTVGAGRRRRGRM